MTISMSRFTARRLALLFGVVFLAASCGVSRGDGGAVVGTVTYADGSSVEFTQSDLNALADGLRASPGFIELIGIDPEQIDVVALDQLLRSEIYNHVLEANGGSVTTADTASTRDELEGELVNIFTQADDANPTGTATEVGDNISAYIDVLAVQIQASEKLPEFVTTDEVGAEVPCVRHILLEAEAEAEGVLAELEAGADFAEVAAEKSIGPTGPTGGELGCAPADGYVPEFRDAVLAAAENEAFGPVQTDFGFHVIEVTGYEQQPVDPQLAVGLALQAEYDSLSVDVDSEIGIWDEVANQVVALAP